MKGNIGLNTAQTKPRNFQLRKNSSPDRRCGVDRRKSYNPEYLKNGGVEKRSWHERRNLWYMTM